MRSRLLIAMVLLSAALLPRCMRVTDGIEVDVAYQTEATPAQIRTDLGYRIFLEHAWMVMGKVELLRCDNFVLKLGRMLRPSRARAHALDTPTSLGVPVVLDLVESAGGPHIAGTLKPPPGRYCGIRILGMPADRDAAGLTRENLEMMQQSVLVKGRMVNTANGQQAPFEARIWEIIDWKLSFDRPLVFEGPALEAISIRIGHTRWFDGIDFAFESPDAVQQQLTQNIRSSLQALLPYAEERP